MGDRLFVRLDIMIRSANLTRYNERYGDLGSRSPSPKRPSALGVRAAGALQSHFRQPELGPSARDPIKVNNRLKVMGSDQAKVELVLDEDVCFYPAPPPVALSKKLIGTATSAHHSLQREELALQERTVSMRRFRTEGDDPNEYWAICDACDGAGSVDVVALDDDGSFDEAITQPSTCPACGGLGFIAAEADDFD